ncbi:PA2779 family protein [Zobellella iuensis]|uniref:PA2779 family protein n=1 Tax=Zobellella iuensis TaxID=2803811 RepID=A0ABS1QPC8_9GAMM|nr:PA2779 family protein [Zobellella iuensis]MBL1376703.1 PA2779 family protein [Zobellella iuensis]
MLQPICRIINPVLILSLLMGSMPLTLQAQPVALVSTQQLLATEQVNADRERIRELLARTEVRDQLVGLGVEPAEVAARVAALSDQEVRQMADQLDHLPAGANAAVGALLTVFIILLVTDLLGLTKVFPFTR